MYLYCLNDRLDTEEQWQSLGCCDKEDTCANDHHYLLLENLLSECKPLIINTPRKQKQPKKTNWKQKFQKPQNENICLTYLNMENNGNFHFLSSCTLEYKLNSDLFFAISICRYYCISRQFFTNRRNNLAYLNAKPK